MYEYFESTNPSAGTGNRYVAIIHLIVDEVLLNRAEAYAMLNQLDKSSGRPYRISFQKNTRL